MKAGEIMKGQVVFLGCGCKVQGTGTPSVDGKVFVKVLEHCAGHDNGVGRTATPMASLVLMIDSDDTVSLDRRESVAS